MLLNTERATRLMDDHGLDGLLATSLPNVFYLSGLWSFTLVMWPREAQTYALVTRNLLSQPWLVLNTGEVNRAILDCLPGTRIINHGAYYRQTAPEVTLTPEETRLRELGVDREPEPDALAALVTALEESGLADKTIGMDEDGINPAFVPQLRQRFPRLKIKPAASILRQIRMVKTAEEIRRLRAAARITENAIRASMSVAREGVPEVEFAKAFKKSLIDQGAEPLSCDLRVGRLAAFGISPAGDTPLRRGDRIWFDVGCKFQGYTSDVARTFAFGKPDERAQRYYQALLEGHKRSLEMIKAGVTAEEVYFATVARVREAGIPHFRRHHVGHGIGVEIYDPPVLAPGSETVLEAGMVMNIEPPYYEIGSGALAVEDTLVVTAGQPELLTSLSMDLEVLE